MRSWIRGNGTWPIGRKVNGIRPLKLTNGTKFRILALLDLKFYVLSFISHCRTGSYAYFPAEMAIVEVILRDGVTNSYCRILGPRKSLAVVFPTVLFISYLFSDELPPNMVEAATRYSKCLRLVGECS